MIENEKEALDYLVSEGRITNQKYWENALGIVKNLNFLFIKWANDVKELNGGK